MQKTLTKADIVNAIYDMRSKQKPVNPPKLLHIKKSVDAMISIMRQAIKKDGELLLSGLGKFEVYAKHERKGRNPSTGQSLILPARRVVAFRLSRVFRKQFDTSLGETTKKSAPKK